METSELWSLAECPLFHVLLVMFCYFLFFRVLISYSEKLYKNIWAKAVSDAHPSVRYAFHQKLHTEHLFHNCQNAWQGFRQKHLHIHNTLGHLSRDGDPISSGNETDK